MMGEAERVLHRRSGSVNTYRMSNSRSLLLAAAAEEFARYGREGTRIQAVVQRAGVNERMIYHHFGSKDELYTAVLREQQVELAEAWLRTLTGIAEMDPYDGMRLALAGFFDAISARPLLPALWMHEALAGWQTMPVPTADMLPSPIRKLYLRGQREGVFRRDCPFELAYAIAISALVALPTFAPRFAGILPPDGRSEAEDAELRDRVVAQLLDGMTGPHPSTAGEANPP
jgi:AcrR family transcriptional regulator